MLIHMRFIRMTKVMTTTLLLRINKFNTVIRAFISKYQSSVWWGTIFGPESVRKWSSLRV